MGSRDATSWSGSADRDETSSSQALEAQMTYDRSVGAPRASQRPHPLRQAVVRHAIVYQSDLA